MTVNKSTAEGSFANISSRANSTVIHSLGADYFLGGTKLKLLLLIIIIKHISVLFPFPRLRLSWRPEPVGGASRTRFRPPLSSSTLYLSITLSPFVLYPSVVLMAY